MVQPLSPLQLIGLASFLRRWRAKGSVVSVAVVCANDAITKVLVSFRPYDATMMQPVVSGDSHDALLLGPNQDDGEENQHV